MAHDFYRDKRVLVTGGAGFIGSHLVEALLDAHAMVTVVTHKETNLWRLVGAQNRIDILETDLHDARETQETFQQAKPEIVFNLASLVRTEQSLDIVDDLLRGNVLIAKHVFGAARAVGVKKCVHVGSIEEYGHGTVPFVEEAREEPISPYSLAKVMTTHLAMLFHRLGGLRMCVVRPAATYGPRQGFGMLTPNFIKSCLEKKDFSMNPGEQVRDLIFVRDVAAGMLSAGAAEESDGEVINLGSGSTYQIREVTLLINQLLGAPITIHFGAYPYRPLDTMRFYMDSHKAHRLLGWYARTDLISGMTETVEWYQQHYQEMPR